MPLSLALNSAANESYKDDFGGGAIGLVAWALMLLVVVVAATNEGIASSLHSDSRLLVPVSLPRDDSKARCGGASLERFGISCRLPLGESARFGGGTPPAVAEDVGLCRPSLGEQFISGFGIYLRSPISFTLIPIL